MAKPHLRLRSVALPAVACLVALWLSLDSTAVVQAGRSSHPSTGLGTGPSTGLGTGQPPPTQQPPPTPPPAQDPQRPPPIRTGADIVRVDATVIDGKGLPVPSLTADDFEVSEDDVPQTIQTFKFVSANGHPEEGDELSLPIRSRAHAAQEASRDDVRVFLIFWDEYHINRFGSSLDAREYLMKFVKSAFGPKDLVAFMDPLTPTDAIKFTRDRHELGEHVRKLQGRLGVYSPVRSVLEEAQLYSREGVERLRSQVTLTALKSAAVHLGSLRQGRKAIILISEGMRDLGRDEPTMIGDLVRSANDANAAIYTINPLGLTLRRQPRFDMLQALASSTGGESFITNDFERALNRVVTQSSAFYLLGYAPGQRALDGRFHRIRVRVKRNGLYVRARSGYWAPTISDMQRVSKMAKDALPPAVAGAFAELSPATARRAADIWVGTGIGSEGRSEVRLVWAPRSSESGTEGPEPASASAIATNEGGIAFNGEVDRRGVTFEASPGALKIALEVRDAGGEIVDRRQQTVHVPDPATTGLWLSTPLIIRTSSPLELRSARTDASPTPAATREFSRSDRLLIRFAVNGVNASQSTVTARLLNHRAAPLTNLTVTRLGGGYEIDFPLSSITRGDFVLAISATHDNERGEVLVPLRIVR